MSKYSEHREGTKAGLDATTRPDGVQDCHLEYLDELRESGVTNMLGAGPYLMDAFDELDQKTASMILAYWMKSFGKPNR